MHLFSQEIVKGTLRKIGYKPDAVADRCTGTGVDLLCEVGLKLIAVQQTVTDYGNTLARQFSNFPTERS